MSFFTFQKLDLVPVPRESYGQFYNGDAYMILSCTEYGQPGGMDTKVKKYLKELSRVNIKRALILAQLNTTQVQLKILGIQKCEDQEEISL